MVTSEEQHARYFHANETFYKSRPWSYFRVRAAGLMLVGSQSAHLGRALEEGISFQGAFISEPPSELTDEQERQYAVHHAAVDSQILLHHAAEAVLRVYLAHVGDSPCPWLAIARGRSWKTFEDKVTNRVLRRSPDASFEADCARVFLRPEIEGHEMHAELTVAYMREFARVFVHEAEMYNSLKHGLTALPGSPVLKVSAGPDSLPAITAHGPAVEYIKRTDDPTTGRTTWRRENRWLDVTHSLALVEVAASLLESAWTVAQLKFLGETNGGIRSPSIGPSDLPRRAGMDIGSFSMFTILEEVTTGQR